MRVSRITNNYPPQNNYNQPSFGTMNIDKSIFSMLSKEESKLVKQWEQDLSRTKYFDLNIQKDYGHRLFINFEHKTAPQYSSEAPLKAWQQHDTVVRASAVDNLNCGDWINYDLNFPTEKRAKEVFNTLQNHEKNKDWDNPFKNIAWAVDATKSLDESFEHTSKKTIATINTQSSTTTQNNRKQTFFDSLLEIFGLQRIKNK